MYGLHGKTAIVTGAVSGIGRGIASRLGEEGASVVVADVKLGERADTLIAEILAAGGKAVSVEVDISSAVDVVRLFDTSEKRFGGVDIVVNNAGITVFGPLQDATDEQFDTVFAVNARGTFLMVREAARRLRDNGRLINISS